MTVTDFDLYEESIDIEIDDIKTITVTTNEFERFLKNTQRLEVLEEEFNGEYLSKTRKITMREYWLLNKSYHLVDIQDFINNKYN